MEIQFYKKFSDRIMINRDDLGIVRPLDLIGDEGTVNIHFEPRSHKSKFTFYSKDSLVNNISFESEKPIVEDTHPDNRFKDNYKIIEASAKLNNLNNSQVGFIYFCMYDRKSSIYRTTHGNNFDICCKGDGERQYFEYRGFENLKTLINENKNLFLEDHIKEAIRVCLNIEVRNIMGCIQEGKKDINEVLSKDKIKKLEDAKNKMGNFFKELFPEDKQGFEVNITYSPHFYLAIKAIERFHGMHLDKSAEK